MPDELEFPDLVPWSQRVRVSSLGGGFAYVPGSVILGANVTDDDLARVLGPEESAPAGDAPVPGFRVARGAFDELRVVGQLRAEGLSASPEHVLFAHASCPCCCGPHPAFGHLSGANPTIATGAAANPMWAQPMWAQPMWAQPMWAQPMWAQPMWAQQFGPTRSTARPAGEPDWYEAPKAVGAKKSTGSSTSVAQQAPAQVVVIDTGLARANHRPQMLAAGGVVTSAKSDDIPDANGDRWLDPVAGHGTFIAGVIQRVAPGCRVEVRGVLTPQGDAPETAICSIIESIAALPKADRPDFLNLSFGGYVWDHAPLLAAAVSRAQANGIVVVASAGNDGTCRESFPAALPGVVSVGAIGPFGPAPFSNYGPWVRACAPGVDVVSSFFTNFDGREVATGGVDIDRFDGWARWSGTSFAAPVVVGALVREMRISGCTNAQAVARVVDASHLGRIAGLGTVVNA